MAERTVNARQLEVLKWIAEGCPDDVMTGDTHKVTARALESRGLVKVSGSGASWKAQTTDAGRYFVEHGEYPAGHWSKGRAKTSKVATASASGEPRGPGPGRVTALRPVDQMIADLITSGGTLTVASPQDSYWEGLAASAAQFHKVPAGKILKVERGRDWTERVLRLEDQPAWMRAELGTVPVSDELRQPHPVVRALRDDRQRLRMKGETRTRALRILDAIAKACQARAYPISAPTAGRGYGDPQGYLTITIRGQAHMLDLVEVHDQVPHQPTALELRNKARNSWAYIPDHDAVPSGRLRLTPLSGWAVHQKAFADTKTIRLEDRLPVVLQELELRAAAQEERDRRIAAERQERRRRWRQFRDEAEVAVRDAHRAGILRQQVENWQLASQVDAYLAAMVDRIAVLDGDEHAAATEWIAWAREYQTRLDPLNGPLAIPADPRFTPDALAPFMRGLPAYEPD
jgi:hypothetical protein